MSGPSEAYFFLAIASHWRRNASSTSVSRESGAGELDFRIGREFDFGVAARFVARLVEEIETVPLPEGTLLNINVPAGQPEGVALTKLGKRIYQNVSKEAWAGWLKHQTMLVNENRLNLADQRARQYLARQMELHFFGTGAEQAAGYVPPTE